MGGHARGGDDDLNDGCCWLSVPVYLSQGRVEGYLGFKANEDGAGARSIPLPYNSHPSARAPRSFAS